LGRNRGDFDHGFASAMDESLVAYFERVVSEQWHQTYDQLNIAANCLARALIARGGAPGDRIAILMLIEISQRDLAKSVAKYLKKQRKKYPDAPHVHPSHIKNLMGQSKYYDK
jgi:non-ribosomal peptide synthetase component F